ncbi:hypothetical protein IKS38_02200 [bacterium]|nr:hypothetical protein [bacterium]
MKKTALVLIAFSLLPAFETFGDLAFSIIEPGYKRYDTSLELVKNFSDYLVIISPDGENWEYLQEHDGISCGRQFASLAMNGNGRNIFFSLAKKLPAHYVSKNILGIKPIAVPVARNVKARATNFLTLSFDKRFEASLAGADSQSANSINFRLLTDGDEDGLPDTNEYEKYGAWPGLYDTDRDGLSDGEEVALGLLPYMADSDGDGIDDPADPHPLTPEYELSYSAWISYWNTVCARFQVSNDGLTKTAYNDRIDPFFDYMGVTAKFSPESITLETDLPETNVFEVSFLCSGVVTGLLYTAECFGLDYEKAQFLPDDKFLSLPEGSIGLPFIARCGEQLRFRLISETDNKEAGQIMVKTADGDLPTVLPINYNDSQSLNIELTAPENEAEFSSPFAFSWTSSNDTVTNYVLTITGPDYYEHSLSNNSLSFTPGEKGRYLWQVTAQGEQGAVSSEIRTFFILDDDYEKDSDGDGFSDNEELKEGYDPFDKSDMPMRLATNLLPVGEKDLFYFMQLNVSGGSKPLFWKIKENSSRGLSVNENGMLMGIPLQTGSFSVSLEIKDQIGRVLNISLPLRIIEKVKLNVQPGLGGFLIQ